MDHLFVHLIAALRGGGQEKRNFGMWVAIPFIPFELVGYPFESNLIYNELYEWVFNMVIYAWIGWILDL